MAILIRRGVLVPAGGNSVAFTNFIARALVTFPTLDAAHQGYYQTLLNGLTTDGLFNSDGTSSSFDLLYIFATQDNTVARLNLVSSSFSVVDFVTGLVFTTDRGFVSAGVSGTTSGGNTQYDPTVNATNLALNNTHLSVWNLTNATDANAAIGNDNAAFTQQLNIYVKLTSDNKTYFRTSDGSAGVVNADPRGHLLGTRPTNASWTGYQNASSINSGTDASTALTPISIGVCGSNVVTSGFSANGTHQLAMASVGANLSGTQVTAFYNRLRAYMTSVGVP